MINFTVNDIIKKLNFDIDCESYMCTVDDNKFITTDDAIKPYVIKINKQFHDKIIGNSIDRNLIDEINKSFFYYDNEDITGNVLLYVNFMKSEEDKIYFYSFYGFSDGFINTYKKAYVYSFLRFILNKFFEEGKNVNINLNDYLILKTREYIQYIIKTVDSSAESSINTLFDQINYISTLPYEGSNISSKLVIMDKKSIEPYINYYIELKEPIKFTENRKIRKLLEISDKNIYLIGDSSKIYGLGKFKTLNKLQSLLKDSTRVLVLDFIGEFEYKINTIFIDNIIEKEYKNEELVKWALKEANLVNIKYGKPNLEENRYSESLLENSLKETFKDSFKDNNAEKLNLIKKIISYAKEQKHGTMVVITTPEIAKDEVSKLKNQSINIKEKQFSIKDPHLKSLIRRITNIDGALYIDTDGYCYAIGVILDGITCEDCGDSSRGARYNSALKYCEKDNLKSKCLIVVISEDGMIDIIPKSKTDINKINELMNKCKSLYNQKNYKEALKATEEAIKLDGENYKLFNNRGLLYAKLKEDKKALNAYNKAIELNPDYDKVYNNRGNLYTKLEQYEEALNDYNKAIELNQDYVEAYNNRALLYADLEQYEEALNDYNKAIELNQDYAEIYNNRGILYTQLEEDEKALNNYNKAIELNPDYDKAYNNRGNLYNKLGEIDKALNDYNKCAVLYIQLGELNLAMQKVTIAINIDGTNEHSYFILSEIYFRNNNMNEFYKNIELALQYGFPVENICNYELYKTVLNDPKLLEIIEKYKKEN